MNILNLIIENLVSVFGLKILEFFEKAADRQAKTLTNGGVAAGKYKRSTLTAWSTDITFLDHDVLEWAIQAHHHKFLRRRSGGRLG
jgi:hypothetical protein